MKINSGINVAFMQKTSFKDELPPSLLPKIEKDAFECYGIGKYHGADGMGIGAQFQAELKEKGFDQGQRVKILECLANTLGPRITILDHLLEKVKSNVQYMTAAVVNTAQATSVGYYDKKK